MFIIFQTLQVFTCLIVRTSKFSREHKFVQVIHDKFGIVEGLMTTVHAMTGEKILLIIYPFDLSGSKYVLCNLICC